LPVNRIGCGPMSPAARVLVEKARRLLSVTTGA